MRRPRPLIWCWALLACAGSNAIAQGPESVTLAATPAILPTANGVTLAATALSAQPRERGPQAQATPAQANTPAGAPAGPPLAPGADPWVLLERMPSELRGLVSATGLGEMMKADPGAPLGPLQVLLPLNESTRRAWTQLAAKLGWTEGEALERLLGTHAVFAWSDALPGKGVPNNRWGLLAVVSADTERQLRAKLEVAPRAIVQGKPVLALEGGNYLLAAAPITGPKDAAAPAPAAGGGNTGAGGSAVILCIAPADAEGLFDVLLPVLAGPTPVVLAKAGGLTGLRALGDGHLRVLARIGGADGQPARWDDAFQCVVRRREGGASMRFRLRDPSITRELIGPFGTPSIAPSPDPLANPQGREVLARGYEPALSVREPDWRWRLLRPWSLIITAPTLGAGVDRFVSGPNVGKALGVERTPAGRVQMGCAVRVSPGAASAAAGDAYARVLADALAGQPAPRAGDVPAWGDLPPSVLRRQRIELPAIAPPAKPQAEHGSPVPQSVDLAWRTLPTKPGPEPAPPGAVAKAWWSMTLTLCEGVVPTGDGAAAWPRAWADWLATLPSDDRPVRIAGAGGADRPVGDARRWLSRGVLALAGLREAPLAPWSRTWLPLPFDRLERLEWGTWVEDAGDVRGELSLGVGSAGKPPAGDAPAAPR